MDLTTTNVLLGIMAAVSVLEALALIGIAYAGYRVYRQAQRTLQELEGRYVQPTMARVEGVLSDVRSVTARVSAQADRVDSAIRTTLERVDTTTDRVRAGMSQRVRRAIGVWRGVRTAFSSFVNGNGTDGRSAGADRSVTATGL